ncbi:MAG: class A beta-lactamase-related serine hydrolase [Rubrobacter sp.]|nr:class A beta-lactamase-related serine hydrolase [Rubrobacter sp.]
MGGLLTGRKALLALALGGVAALSIVLALLQLQSVNERLLGSSEERVAAKTTQEATQEAPDGHGALLERVTVPSIEETERDSEPRPVSRESDSGEEKDAELESEVRRVSASHQGEYGVVLWQPGSGRKVSVGAGDRFDAASLAKLPVLLALYREADQGRLSLDERIKITPSSIKSGTGELQNRPPGTSVTLRECAKFLMKESDNTAWAMLEDRLGNDRIRSEITSTGARSTSYEYAKHSTTPDDTVKMLQKISDPGYTSERHSRQMLGYMTGTSFESWLPQGLPREARISHKIGILGGSFGDAGIVYPPEDAGSQGPYYVAVLAKDTTEPQARDAMQDISLAAYREFVDPEAKPRS